MADHTHIEWTDATWNPITGCSVVSPGCTNCYAMRLAGTRLRDHPSRAGLTQASKAGPVWTGEVRFNPDWLDQPLRWRRPRRIFVCAHADLFHENVPDEWIDRVFVVMALATQHTFQVLTKRAARMRAYLSDPSLMGRLSKLALRGFPAIDGHPGVKRFLFDHPDRVVFPFPNVHAGVSVEDQPRADERLPELMATPAAVRWVSLEPMIGPVDMAWALDRNPIAICAGILKRGHFAPGLETLRRLDGVVLGGEDGDRPIHPGWARQVRDDCDRAQVPFFFKQWGAWASVYDRDRDDPDWRRCADFKRFDGPAGRWLNLVGGHGFHGACVHYVRRVGKKAAGRLLDGREHNDLPAPRALTATGA